jgi:exopolyphosphatase / guanosine-5'-triphosphate,3'-diphosphate pyrophosphatase
VKFAAIDIGSNGARMLISRVLIGKKPETPLILQTSFKAIEYLRFPLRLGKDVFTHKKVSDKKKEQVLKLMEAFKLLIELHEVDDFMALATSAFREASNGQEMVEMVKKKVGVKIEIIDGSREAEILGFVIVKYLEDHKNYIHVDVGGGSTEITLYEGKLKTEARSFPMGSVRNAGSKKTIQTLKEMEAWIHEKVLLLRSDFEIISIGTGGNINKIHGLIDPNLELINAKQIRALQLQLNQFSFEDKINILKLNPDRADTILPASHIYLSAMEWAGTHQMLVPKVGLKDGMMEMMLERNMATMNPNNTFVSGKNERIDLKD